MGTRKKQKGRVTAARQWQARIEVAARMRARSATWEEIAKRLGYASAHTAMQTLTNGNHRETWNEELGRAVREWMSEGMEPDALAVMRKLMMGADSPDPEEKKIAEAAAHSVLGHAAKLRGMVINLKRADSAGEADRKQIEDARRASNALAEGK